MFYELATFSFRLFTPTSSLITSRQQAELSWRWLYGAKKAKVIKRKKKALKKTELAKLYFKVG